MKKICLVTVLLIFGISGFSWAEENDPSVGVTVGTDQQQSNYNAPSIVFEGSGPNRQFPNTPGFLPAYPPSGFVPPGNPYTDIRGEAFATFGDYYTREMLEGIIKGQKFDDVKVVNYYGLKPKEEEIPPGILFVFGADSIPSGLYFIDSGTVDVKTKPDGKTSSFGAIAKAGLEALLMGANTIVLYSQGVERQLKTKSISIGLSASGAGVPGEETAANMVGGTGFGSGSSGYRYPAWVHAYVGKMYTEEEIKKLANETKKKGEKE